MAWCHLLWALLLSRVLILNKCLFSRSHKYYSVHNVMTCCLYGLLYFVYRCTYLEFWIVCLCSMYANYQTLVRNRSSISLSCNNARSFFFYQHTLHLTMKLGSNPGSKIAGIYTTMESLLLCFEYTLHYTFNFRMQFHNEPKMHLNLYQWT